MKLFKTSLILLLSILGLSFSFQKNNLKITTKDFKQLIGNWEGSLTYLDYSTAKPYTMPANIEVIRIKKTNSYIFASKYPNEANANSSDTITISKAGNFFGKEAVKAKKKLANGDTEIITEELGKDGNDDMPAIIRHTYTFGELSFCNKKEVQFIGKAEWIKRHEYSYKRKKA
ncbi:MAG: hypothetical protein H0U95_09300 [Bacteroidetes bacterium]|nr:hypothetical protein [Bacteroidota bacterium]